VVEFAALAVIGQVAELLGRIKDVQLAIARTVDRRLGD